MNRNSFITLTFGDQAENHTGMEKLGKLVNKGEGFDLADLQSIKTKLEEIGSVCDLIQLRLNTTEEPILHDPEKAYVLVIRDGVNKILENCAYEDTNKYNLQGMFEEHICLDVDKLAWMHGRLVNKHARWNLCFDDESREPDYENKKGRIVGYSQIPITQQLLNELPKYFGEKAKKLKGEGNYYYDVSSCGIGFHGDSERRKVIGIRLGIGVTPNLHYQWFIKGKPTGDRIIIPLNGGDIYIMSEKAVGTDWKKKNIYTLRHATGCEKYTKINK